MSVKALKQKLKELNIDYSNCYGKEDFEILLERAEADLKTSNLPSSVVEPTQLTTPNVPAVPRMPPEHHAPKIKTIPQPPHPGRTSAQTGAQEEPLIQEVLREDDTGIIDCKTIRNLSRGRALGPGRLLFRGHSFWQELLQEHVTTAGLEFHVALHTGRNFARIPHSSSDCQPPKALAHDNPAYIAAATCIADAEPSQEDEVEVEKAVRAAASWGNAMQVRCLIVSCFVPARACSGALCEAAGCGHEETVEELLRARALPLANDGTTKKTALHFACEKGHEGIAKKLLAGKADLNAIDAFGRTPCDLARAQDLGIMAKRLEKLV